MIPLRYVELNINQIFNKSAPEHQTAWFHLPEKYRENWWDASVIEMRQYFGRVWTEEFDKITQHFSSLERSIKEQGILHPVSIMCGNENTDRLSMFPPVFQKNRTECMYTYPFGGSRLSTATKLGIETIPCVIHDKYNLFPEAKEVNRSNYKRWFDNGYFFTNELPYVRIERHIHLDSKFAIYNQQTKTAQQQAAKIAKQKTLEKYG